MPNITDWFRSAGQFAKAFGWYWFAAVVLAWDFADVWASLRVVFTGLPPLPDRSGEIVTAVLLAAVVVGGVQAYHELRMKLAELRRSAESGWDRCVALESRIRDAEDQISRWKADEMEAAGMTGWVEKWEHDVEILLEDDFGGAYAEWFTDDLQTPGEPDHIFDAVHLIPRLQERVGRLKKIRDEECRGTG